MNKHRMLTGGRPGGALRLGVIALLSFAAAGLLVRAAAQDAQDLTVSADFAGRPVPPGTAITLTLSRPLQKGEGQFAVLVGQADLTSLFAPVEGGLRYNPETLPLPEGETAVTVYLVTPGGEWRELARLPLKVARPDPAADRAAPPADPNGTPPAATPPAEAQPAAQPDAAAQPQAPEKRFGFDKLDLLPSLTLNLKSQPAEKSSPDANQPQRRRFTDLTLQGSFKTDVARGGFLSQTQFDLVGSSFRNEALRFGQLGDDAPRVDLASYLMQFQTGKTRYLVGHTSYGTNRHLINNFSSRGLTLTVPINPRFDFSLAAMNGSSIVGFDNFFGLNKRRHQLMSGTLGVEFLPQRPGGLRLEAGTLDGWLLPVGGVNQGVVNDAERSRGAGLRVVASDAKQRLRFDGGFTRSQFTNPSDALLNQSNNIAETARVTRNASYVDAAYDLLKDFALGKGEAPRRLTLTLNYRFERVDPLFRSLGVVTQADRQQNEFLALGSLGEITGQYSHTRFNDNLADIASILKTLTRRNAFALAGPLAAFFGNPASPSPLLPRVAYTFDRTSQFGAAVPVGGGFNAADIPDLTGTNQAFTADWQLGQARLGYRFNRSFQDNRQLGREFADLINLVHGVTFGRTFNGVFDLNVDVNAESARDRLADTINRTLRLAPNFTWRVSQRMTLASTISGTLAGDDADTINTRNSEFDVQWAYRFGIERSRFQKLQGQFFIRYANVYAQTRNPAFGVNTLNKSQIVNLGLSFTFF